MRPPTLAASFRQSGTDLVVGVCGLVTSLLTALILWWVETRFGFSLYTWSLGLVVPVGAVIAGLAGASGYVAGAKWLGKRPSNLLRANVVLASLATCALLYYLPYANAEFEGRPLTQLVSFPRYLDYAVRQTSLVAVLTSHGAIFETGSLGIFGYLYLLLQVSGFSLGGVLAYRYLASQPCCPRCSRYLSIAVQQVRYFSEREEVQSVMNEVVSLVAGGAVTAAVGRHLDVGRPPSEAQDDSWRLEVEVRTCEHCVSQQVKVREEELVEARWTVITGCDVDAMEVTGQTTTVTAERGSATDCGTAP